MFYQYTGQPGHGKTVLAIESAISMKEKADKLHADDPSKHPVRELYVCNVRDFNHGVCGALELSPDELKTWHADPRFDHAIILVDEAYEHGMFPRRPPGRPVPEHVQQVAKHRHRGIDFIMICQSPKKQMDDFLHDLIEEHYHIRRRYGLPFAHVKRWDRYESNPDKADSLTTSRRKYPKHIFRLYTSTKYDTSEKRVPWFYWAAGALLLFVLIYGYIAVGGAFDNFRPGASMDHVPAAAATGGNGAAAKVTPGAAAFSSSDTKSAWATTEDYLAAHTPRIASMPWTAPVFDSANPTVQPEVYCMASDAGLDGAGGHVPASCRCLTEQGTQYVLPDAFCRQIARYGPAYNPYRRPIAEGGRGPQGVEPAGIGERPSARQAAPTSDTSGGTLISVQPRALATFPESTQNRYGGG